MARTPYKMKSSPAKGILSDFFQGINAKKTDMGEVRAKQRRSSKGISEFEYRKTKEYRTEKAKRSMVDKNKDNISDFVQPHSITSPTPPGQETVSPKAKTKKTKFSGSGTDARKKQYDAKGWAYDDTIKGYNRDGTKITTKKDIIRNKIEMIDPSSEILDTLDEIKAYGSVKNKDVKKSFDFNKANDYSSSAVNKKSPSKKRGYKMNRKKQGKTLNQVINQK